MVRLDSPSSALRSSAAFESNTSHSMSARLKTAAGAGPLNGKVNFRLAPLWTSSTAILPEASAALAASAAGPGCGGGALCGACGTVAALDCASGGTAACAVGAGDG